ncbi:MAG: ATP-dependent DNA helicase [Actinomycetota bacterium]|nr:ATP-dependent DNA helicase [Actinomycetota bacterium]
MLDDSLIDIIEKGKSDSLVIGPPGSGKTYALLELVKYLVNVKKINPEKLLIFCFNRRWSKIIREKATSLINRSILEIPIETFHSFSLSFIAESKSFLYKGNSGNGNEDNPFEDIKILNSVQQWEFLKEVIKELDGKKYPRTFKYMNSNKFIESSFVQEVFDFILRAQENLFTPEELSDKFTPFFSPLLSELSGIYSRYTGELKKNKFYNYGMLLAEAVSILKKRKKVSDYYRKKYEYIIVDELQELNKAQFEIINCISDSNCIFFGNDDQSIYTFRGSALDIFKSVYTKLKQEKIYFLRENHRSSSIINEACSRFINLSENRIPKESITPGSNSSGEFQVKNFYTLLEEANFICNKIKYLYLNKGIKLEEMAIVIKGLGYETHIIESALIQNGIPFVRRGTRSLLDNRIVKYLLNFLRFLVTAKEIEKLYGKDTDGRKGNKKGSDFDSNNDLQLKIDSFLGNIMLSDIVNLEPLFFKRVRKSYSERSSSGGGEFKNLWDYFRSFSREKNKRNTETCKITDFVSVADKLLEIMDTGVCVFDFLMLLVRDEKAGVLKYLLEGAGSRAENRNNWNNLSDFLNNVKDFSSENKPDGAGAYINFIDNIIESKFTEEIEQSTKDLIQPGSVNILSFHQCKGLEFEAVFTPFINRDYLPAKFVNTQAFDIQIFNYLNGAEKLKPIELKKEHLYGEMKLFYNGITRVKEYLYITSSSRVKSIIYERIRDIYDDLNKKYKNADGYKNIEYGKGKEKIKNDSSSEKTEIKEMWELPGLDLNNLWLVRKKAMVAAYKRDKGLSSNSRSYLNEITILKHFYNPGEWWSFVKATKNSKNPLASFPPSFSHSSINAYMDCPFKYKIRYFLKLVEEDNLSLIIGKVYHRIMRKFFEGKDDYSWKKLVKIINGTFEEYDFEYDFLKRDLKEKVLEQFENFYRNLMPKNPHKSVVERGFQFEIGGEKIRGRIDQINFIDESNIELVDYKSSSSSYSSKELREELQLKLYRTALELSDDLKKLRSMNVEMKYICLGNLKKPVSVMPADYYNLNEVKNILKENIAKIKSGRFSPEPKSSNSCLNCGFKVLCPKYYG